MLSALQSTVIARCILPNFFSLTVADKRTASLLRCTSHNHRNLLSSNAGRNATWTARVERQPLRSQRGALVARPRIHMPRWFRTCTLLTVGGAIGALMAYGVYVLVTHRQEQVKKPHIIFILADDLGWADVSFHGCPQIPTPNLDTLAADGVVLNNYYVHPTCTASRGALMTGLYSTRYGLQHIPIQPGEPYGLDLKYTLLPGHLKRLGYETHLIGKWHLGSYRYEYTPTRRGFDSFYGFYYGHEDYHTHMLHHSQDGKEISGLDLWNGTEPAEDAMGVYGTELFAEKAVRLIQNMDKSKPQFLYLSQQAVHSGNDDDPLQSQKKNVDKFPYIGEKNRTIYAGMVDSLDEAVGSVMRALGEAGMLQDSVIVFSSDNGGVPWGYMASRGINWPLRGAKSSPWEGGSRAAAFLWSPLLDKSRRVSQQLMHITDWLPTFYALAGGLVSDLGPLDGKDMWAAVSRDEPSPRSDIVYNIDPLWNYAAIRRDSFKIVVGSHVGGRLDQHFPIPGGQGTSQKLDALMERSLAAEVLESMNRALEEYRAQTVPPLKPAVDPTSFPENHNGTWAPWVD
ncbi:arylsulfatase B-like isoform X2 [Dermacentor andersoni]|uniref:arylsulfatase B-like isoform X2 n=1 Tax=Dermacentor andersoni TaxID=34620 RepID=UPI0024160DCC|nr:arylsulfatase B-like isoform X2 [Dermacentor andersoni]